MVAIKNKEPKIFIVFIVFLALKTLVDREWMQRKIKLDPEELFITHYTSHGKIELQEEIAKSDCCLRLFSIRGPDTFSSLSEVTFQGIAH